MIIEWAKARRLSQYDIIAFTKYGGSPRTAAKPKIIIYRRGNTNYFTIASVSPYFAARAATVPSCLRSFRMLLTFAVTSLPLRNATE